MSDTNANEENAINKGNAITEKNTGDTGARRSTGGGAVNGEPSQASGEGAEAGEGSEAKADEAQGGERSFWSTRRILVTVVFLAFVVFVTYRVLNQFADQPYMEVPHGDHVHYVPKDRDQAVPLSDFPTQAPAANERILPDGRVVQTGPPVQP